jgi:SAM-dependent methyltransferase
MRDEASWILGYALRSSLRATNHSARLLPAWYRFWRSYSRYRDLVDSRGRDDARYLYPCLYDETGQTIVEPIYFYQNAWAFERIVAARPERHVDVGSQHTFVALLSKVVPVTMVDIRPLSVVLNSLEFRQGSILELPYETASLHSISSICVVEHIGLGRYGDPLDPSGTEKALAELKRVVAPGGFLYLSVPLDDENRTYFNAHRAFTESYLEKLFAPFQVVDRRYIFGAQFLDSPLRGFGTGCYQLQRP